MKIKGANLGVQEVEFNKLTNFEWTKNADVQKLISYIENIYCSILQKKDISTIQTFPVDENGKVIIKPGMINHKCANDFEILNFISKYGVLASEWFGILESEREGCFCTFVSRLKSEDYPYKGDLAEDNYSRLNIGKNIILFFDATNPIMQYLLHLDFFEYEKIKNSGKDKLHELYTKEEIEMFDKLIEPLSPAGLDMRKEYEFKTNYWSAIPGGIPSFLINGICIKNNAFTEATLDEVSKLFPNATIFNGNLDVVRYEYYKTVNSNEIDITERKRI